MAPSRRSTPSAQLVNPSSTAPVGGRTRSTRSQTTEPQPSTQPAPRRGTRQESVESNASAGSRPSRTRARVEQAQQKIAEIDLTAVPEEEDEEEEIEEPDLNLPDPDINDHDISGTTALSNSSDDEDDIDPRNLLEHGEEVYLAAVALLKLLDQHRPRMEAIAKAIDNLNSAMHKRFAKNYDHLKIALEKLGDEFKGVLNPQEIMEQLFGSRSLPPRTSPCWHVLEFVQLLNLANISYWVATASPDSVGTADRLAQLSDIFPQPFLANINGPGDSGKLLGNSSYEHETFDIALDLRLHATAMRIVQQYGEEDFDVDACIHDKFFSSPQGAAIPTFKHWDINTMGGGDSGMTAQYEQKIKNKVERLRILAHETEEGEGLDALRTVFPWSKFRTNMLRWSKLRLEELTGSIDASGGITVLMTEWSMELAKNPSYHSAANLLSQSQDTQEQRIATQPVARQTTAERTSSAPRESPRPRVATEEFPILEDVEAAMEQSVDRSKAAKLKAKALQRKENQRGSVNPSPGRFAFIDPQVDAERIDRFDEGSQPSPTAQRKKDRAGNGRGTTLLEANDDESPSEDEGFQQDARPSQGKRRRPQGSANLPIHPGPKRVRIEERPSQASPRATAGNSELIQSTHTLAREVARSNSERPKPIQTRRVWSSEEEAFLENSIREHGTSWSRLKKLDTEGILDGRDQVALKDKARNMKVALLLSGTTELPANFELINLDKNAIARLNLNGIRWPPQDED